MRLDFGFLGKALPDNLKAELRKKLLKELEFHQHVERNQQVPISCQIKAMEVSSSLEQSWFVHETLIIAYFENYDVMVLTDARHVLEFLAQREPWQDFDVCLFDQEITWCAALTHNDEAKYVKFTKP